jgi:hypothetical protein
VLLLNERHERSRQFTIAVDAPPGIYFLTLFNEKGQQAVVKVEIH